MGLNKTGQQECEQNENAEKSMHEGLKVLFPFQSGYNLCDFAFFQSGVKRQSYAGTCQHFGNWITTFCKRTVRFQRRQRGRVVNLMTHFFFFQKMFAILTVKKLNFDINKKNRICLKTHKKYINKINPIVIIFLSIL